MSTEAETETGDGGAEFWIFGYGSLMWRPGFAYEERRPAVLRRFHRAFCIYSCYHRGTPDQPGLVLGLDEGGLCRGVAYRVAAGEAAAVRAYLDERELSGYAYKPMTLPVDLAGDAGTMRTVEAYVFVADPEHGRYAGDLGIHRAAEIIIGARGVAGLNRDYLINTVRQMEQMGFVERDLHALLKRVEYLTGVIEAGSGI